MIRPIVCNTEQPQLRQLCGAACRERTGGVMAAAAYRDSATNYYVPASASALCIRLYPSVSIEENTHKIHLFSVLCTTYMYKLACSERRMTMNPTHFLVYLAAVFSCPVLRCINYVFEKIHTCIGKKGYVHLCTYLRKYICIDKKGYIVQKKLPPSLDYITRH